MICGWCLVVNGSFELPDSLLLASQKSGSSILLLFTHLILTVLIQFLLNTPSCHLKTHFLFTARSSSRPDTQSHYDPPFPSLLYPLCSPPSSLASVVQSNITYPWGGVNVPLAVGQKYQVINPMVLDLPSQNAIARKTAKPHSISWY